MNKCYSFKTSANYLLFKSVAEDYQKRIVEKMVTQKDKDKLLELQNKHESILDLYNFIEEESKDNKPDSE